MHIHYSSRDLVRTFQWAAAIYLVLAIVVTHYYIARFPLEFSADLIFDDAYYYLGVAQNIAEGKGSSFGDLVMTNGYQPLWLGILAGVIYLFSFQKIAAFAAIPTLIFLIKSLSLLRLSMLKSAQATPLLFGTALIIMMYQGIFSQGLETCLLLLCLPLLSLLKPFPDRFSMQVSLKYSAIFILLFLVRLDLLAIMAAFALLTCLRIAEGERGMAKNLAVTILLTAVAVSIYFAANYWLFGVIVPISGLSKAVGNKLGENTEQVFKYLVFARFAAGAMLLNYLLCRNINDPTIDRKFLSNELRLTYIAAAIVAFYYAFFSGWPLWSWYYWPIALVTLYSFAKLFYLSVRPRTQFKSGRAVTTTVFFSWCLLAYITLLAIKTEISAGVIRTVVSLHLLDKTPRPNFTAMNIKTIDEFFAGAPDGIVAMGDRAGGLGYWLPSRFKFFHTEGLVANKEYLQARKEGKGVDFLKNIGIKYFVAERERYFDANLADGTPVHGIVEPIQALSVHSGLVVICMPISSILYHQRYGDPGDEQTRYVYDFTKVKECPAEIYAKVNALASNYGALRKYSLESEYKEPSFIRKYFFTPT